MIKRIFTVILISCFLSFVITPIHHVYAKTAEEEAEEDERRAEAVMTAIGVCAVIGALFMLSKMNFFAENKSTEGFKIGFDVYQPDSNYNSFSEKNNNFVPAVKVIYSW